MSAPRLVIITAILLVGLPAATGAMAPRTSLGLVSPLPSASLPVPLPSASLPVPLPSASLPVPLPSTSVPPLPSASVPLPTPSLPLPPPSPSLPSVSVPPLPGTSLPPLPSGSLGGLPSLSPLSSVSPGPEATGEADTDATDQPGAGTGGADSDGGLGSAFQALNDFLEIGLPAVAIGIPLLLALGVLGAQLVGGASLMPVVRRTLGSLGLRRFAPPIDGPAVPVTPASDPPGRRA